MSAYCNKFLSLIVLLFFGLIAYACTEGEARDQGEKARSSQVLSITVDMAEVKRQDVRRYLDSTGNVEPLRSLMVVPQVPGEVESVNVRESERVKKGQALLRLDATQYRLQANQAAAMLDAALAQSESAKADFARIGRLKESNSISQQDFERAQMAYRAASAQAAQAQSMLDLAQYTLNQTVVRAPFDAVVTHLYVKGGELVGPSLAASGLGVMMLMAMDTIEINAHITDHAVPSVTVGNAVEVEVDAYPGEIFDGEVRKVGVASEMILPGNVLTGLFKVTVHVDNADLRIKPGMMARLRIVTTQNAGVIAVPNQGIVSRQNANYVFLVEDGRAIRRAVTPGLRGRRYTEILEGLSEGERIVIEGNSLLDDGTPVMLDTASGLDSH